VKGERLKKQQRRKVRRGQKEAEQQKYSQIRTVPEIYKKLKGGILTDQGCPNSS